MAKTPKSAKSDRQAVLDQMKRRQKGAERTRGLAIVGVCTLIALVLVAIPVYGIVKDKRDAAKFNDIGLSKIGGPASVCGKVTTKKATGNQTHVDAGTIVEYPDAPPAFGKHYPAPDTITRKFFSVEDRPELGTLVHNLEHGYTILWYDETAADDESTMDEIRAIASKFEGDDSNLRRKFKAVPWTSADGAAFPKGQHIALTHWSAGGSGQTDVANQVGVWQYCSQPSGAAVQDFMLKYPYTDSPEPNTP